MVGDEVDDGLEAMEFHAVEQVAELVETFVGVTGVVRADVEVVADGVGGASFAFEQCGVVCGAVGVSGGAGLFQHAGEPDVGDAECLDGCQSGGVNIVEFAAAVFGDGAVEFASFVGVAEVAHHELVDLRSRRQEVWSVGFSSQASG